MKTTLVLDALEQALWGHCLDGKVAGPTARRMMRRMRVNVTRPGSMSATVAARDRDPGYQYPQRPAGRSQDSDRTGPKFPGQNQPNVPERVGHG